MTYERDGVSVIIATRNMGNTLKRAVESCIEADEIVIVNDASKDNTASVILSLRDDTQDIRAINFSKQRGVCEARNTAISLAHYKLIIPLDADDYFLPNGITALHNAYEVGTFVYSGWREVNSQQIADVIDIAAPPIGTIKRKNVAQATWLFAKSDWKRVGGYAEKYKRACEDYALMCAMLQDGVRGKRIEDIVYCYNPSPNGRAAYAKTHFEDILNDLKADYPLVFA